MNGTVIAGVIGTALIAAFLLYYVITVASMPLSVIMIAILLMVVRSLVDDARQTRNKREP